MKKKWVKNSLGFDNELYVYQDKTMFNYSLDTILLANWSTVNSHVNKVLEIGTNNGALSIFLSERKKFQTLDALEIQEKALKIAKENLKLNNKENEINLIFGDFNEFYKEHMKNQKPKYDLIICNPPFHKVGFKKMNDDSLEKLIATHEIKLNLKQMIVGSSKIIQQKGYLSIVIPTERMVDACQYFRESNFEVKRVKLIYPRIHEKSNLVLIEARFNSGWGTFFEKNLYLHPEDKDDHSYLDEVKKYYNPWKAK